MATMFYIYEHIRPDTGVVFYVGKGKGKRAYSKISRNKHWNNIVSKNNGEFQIRILNWFNNEDDAFHAECWQISQLKLSGNLVNLTDGGDGASGSVQSYETIEKRALKLRGKKRSLEIREKFKGENNGMWGKNNSTKQKEAVSKAQKDRPKSYVQRSKTSTKVKGKNNGMYGRSGALNPMYGKVSAMKGRNNPIAAFANYIRHVSYWGA